MEKNRPNQKSQQKKPLEDYARYSGIAGQMLVTILVGVYGGIKFDEWLELKFPAFTLALSFIAVIISMWIIIRNVMKK